MEFKGARDTISERDTVHQLAWSGDQEALGRLLASLMPRLYRAALRIMGTPQDAEEILQDGLLQAVKHLREFEGRAKFSTWLTRIVVNAALMRLRQRRPEVVISIDQGADRDEKLLPESIADPRPNPEEMYAQVECLETVERKLQSLPAAYRSALWLRAVQGMSTSEVAEALGIPEGSLKSNLHRARLRLRAEEGAGPEMQNNFRAAKSKAPRTRRQFSLELAKEVAELRP